MVRSLRFVCAGALVAAGCSDPAVLTLKVSNDNARADGKSAISIEARVFKDEGQTPLDRGSVKFVSDLNGSSFSEIADVTKPPDIEKAAKEVDVEMGIATVRLFSANKGPATVRATFSDPVAKTSQVKTVSVVFGPGTVVNVESFDYVGAVPTQLPLGGSSRVTFRAKDSQEQPVGGVRVVFSITAGQAQLAPLTADTAADGLVSTTLTAKNVPGKVRVQVSHDNGSGSVVTRESDDIMVRSVNAKNLTLVCPHYSIGGLEALGLYMDCTVYGSDYGHAFVSGSQVFFMTEAGGVPGSMGFTQGDDGGEAVFRYRTQCKLPMDVEPLGAAAGDPGTENCRFWNECRPQGADWEYRTCNPRDGLATLVAITTGSEAFDDTNGNGQWDDNERFTDLPEPYVDANDNRTRDADEDFFDANQNGKWDRANGDYDENGAIWTSVKIIWTGAPDNTTIEPEQVFPTPHVPHCTPMAYQVTVRDVNGNAPTAVGSSDMLQATCDDGCEIDNVTPYEHSTTTELNGVVTVTIADPHTCPSASCEAPSCLPEPYTVNFTLKHTIAPHANPGIDTSITHVFPASYDRKGVYE
ncbi:MAG: hypothetical protein HY901_21730 [Deltaproteobacteria bacterium]|nr:hypothetical protein [Deltaproteobacteria bacterium]